MIPVSSHAGHTTSRIKSLTVEGLRNTSADEVKKVLPFHEGDLFDPKKIDQSISYLIKWGRFQKIDMQKTESKEGVSLAFQLQEGILVSGIDIYGGYPYLSRRLRRLITIHPGDLYDEGQATLQVEKLSAFYEKEGYTGTHLIFTPRFNEKKGTVDLVYRILKGARYRVGSVTVLGNTVFPHGYFISQINPLRPYQPPKFRERLEKIRHDYQKKGYLQARIRLKDLGKDPQSHKINPTLEITEGKNATILFEGNHLVSTRTFRQIIPIFTEGGYGDYEINASAQAMLDHYHQLGFQEASIDHDQKILSERHILIRFIIREGLQTRVKKVLIDGNKKIISRKITNRLSTQEETLFGHGYFQPRSLELDMKNLPQVLQNQGALEGKVLDKSVSLNELKDKALVTFSIQEGQITRIDSIRFSGNDHISTWKLKKHLKLHEGNVASPIKIESDQEEMVNFYSNSGFPYIRVSHELIHEKEDTTLLYSIDEGIEVKIGEILIIGNERTLKEAVNKALFVHPGQPFSYRKIRDSENALRRTGSFRSVDIETIGLVEKEPLVHLRVKLEEYRKILLDIGMTYNTDDFFTGTLSLSHLNLFGTVKRANLKLTGGRDIQKGELLLKDPFFLGSHLEAGFNALLARQVRSGFTTEDAGGALSLLKEFNPRATFLGRYELTRTFFSNVTDLTGSTEKDNTTSKVSFSFNYDKRDSFADPQRGFVAFTGFDVSTKLIASTFNFVQPKGYFVHYLRLGSRVTVFNMLRMEGIKVFGGDTLTRNVKLFLGGDYTIRGFPQDEVGTIVDGQPTGGQLLLAETTEIHVKLVNNLKLATFLDNGSITDNFSQVDLSTLRHSAGFGIRYFTPVGPFRLDYGIKLDRQTGESFGRIHFAFGYSF